MMDGPDRRPHMPVADRPPAPILEWYERLLYLTAFWFGVYLVTVIVLGWLVGL